MSGTQKLTYRILGQPPFLDNERSQTLSTDSNFLTGPRRQRYELILVVRTQRKGDRGFGRHPYNLAEIDQDRLLVPVNTEVGVVNLGLGRNEAPTAYTDRRGTFRAIAESSTPGPEFTVVGTLEKIKAWTTYALPSYTDPAS